MGVNHFIFVGIKNNYHTRAEGERSETYWYWMRNRAVPCAPNAPVTLHYVNCNAFMTKNCTDADVIS